MDTSQQRTPQERLAMVSNLMSLQMQPFVTPISGALADGTAAHVGTVDMSNGAVSASCSPTSTSRAR